MIVNAESKKERTWFQKRKKTLCAVTFFVKACEDTLVTHPRVQLSSPVL